MKKVINWNSPKEYQPNNVPRGKKMKLKPKAYCKVLKGNHTAQNEERHSFNLRSTDVGGGKETVWYEGVCVCGHKTIRFI